MIKDESNTKSNVFCHVLNNIGFPMNYKICFVTYAFQDAPLKGLSHEMDLAFEDMHGQL
jgi:hypothetical protein